MKTRYHAHLVSVEWVKVSLMAKRGCETIDVSISPYFLALCSCISRIYGQKTYKDQSSTCLVLEYRSTGVYWGQLGVYLGPLRSTSSMYDMHVYIPTQNCKLRIWSLNCSNFYSKNHPTYCDFYQHNKLSDFWHPNCDILLNNTYW